MTVLAFLLLFLAVFVLVGVPFGVIILLGAIRMRRLQAYRLAVAASVLAMLPCHPGFIVGLPVGIWALLVLSQPEVKAAFSNR